MHSTTALVRKTIPATKTIMRAHAYQPKRWDVDANGALTEENLRAFYEPKGFVVYTTVLEAGKKFDRHKHEADVVVLNLGGKYTIQFDEETVELSPGEFFEFPLGVYHTEIVGDEAMTFGLATKELGFGTILRAINFFQSVKSFFISRTQK